MTDPINDLAPENPESEARLTNLRDAIRTLRLVLGGITMADVGSYLTEEEAAIIQKLRILIKEEAVEAARRMLDDRYGELEMDWEAEGDDAPDEDDALLTSDDGGIGE